MDSGLINAIRLDREGGGKRLSWQEVDEWSPEAGPLWVHLNFEAEDSVQWLRDRSGLDPLIAEALIADETRPRCTVVGDGILISFRGVNNNPGADPEDMVSIRLYCTEQRVISTRRRLLLTVKDLVDSFERMEGPSTSGELIAMLAERLVERMSGVIGELEDRIDELEEVVIEGNGSEVRDNILELRREIIKLRRYLAPQREALNQLHLVKFNWLSENDRLWIREASDKITRYVEELDSARDRAGIAFEELSNRQAEQMNARMYLLSMIAGLFLPLGFLTGLLGINVGGIPLAESHWGFLFVVLFLVVVVALQVVLLRRNKWL